MARIDLRTPPDQRLDVHGSGAIEKKAGRAKLTPEEEALANLYRTGNGGDIVPNTNYIEQRGSSLSSPQPPQNMDAYVGQAAKRIAFAGKTVYERALKKNPEASAKGNVILEINPNGTVRAVDASQLTASGSPGLAGDLYTSMKKLKFDPPPGRETIQVKVPIIYTPKS